MQRYTTAPNSRPTSAVMIIASVFVVFLIQGGIAWPQTIVCAFGAITGGFIGGSVAKRMPVAWRRGVVIAVGVVLTVAYTWLYWIKPFLALTPARSSPRRTPWPSLFVLWVSGSLFGGSV